jgi:hypothetical protein
MNEDRKTILRSMPDLITREEVQQLVSKKPDVWRWVRAIPKVISLLIAYFLLWCVVFFFTDPVTPWFITIMVAGWTAPKYIRRL